jgi:small subunit ribosomal protein S23
MMENVEGMTEKKAYDIVRKDFYRLRHEEDVERRIAQEEARMVGGYFGKTRLQRGMELEDREYESWKVWASGEIEEKRSQMSSMVTSFGTDDVEEGQDAEASKS